MAQCASDLDSLKRTHARYFWSVEQVDGLLKLAAAFKEQAQVAEEARAAGLMRLAGPAGAGVASP